jgi:diguanylate cyclase
MIAARLMRALGSLKFRLGIAAVLALVLGIGITTAVLMQRAETDTLADHATHEAAEAARIARILSLQVVQQQAALALLAQQLQPPLMADRARLQQTLQTMPVLLAEFDSITLITAEGRGIFTLDSRGVRATDIDVADRAYFQRARRESRPLVSEPIISRVSNEVVVLLTHPLPYDGGYVVGGLRLRSRDLLAGLADGRDAHGHGDGPLVLLTDPQGRILAHPDRELISAPISAEPALAGSVERWRAAGAPLEPAGLDLSQGEHLVSVAAVAGADWLVWRNTPRSQVLAPLAHARREALAWAAGLTAALGLALLVWMSLLLRPLARLEERAERLFDGGLDPQAGWPRTGGEIGRLERVLRHVSAERAQLESFNHRVIQRLQSVMAAAPVGIAFTRDRRFELVSRQFCQLLGREEAALLGQPAQQIFVSNEDYLRLGDDLGHAFAAGEVYGGEWQLLRGDGTRIWSRLRAQPVDPAEPQAGTIWTAHDITQEISARQALEWAATHDPLTGLANRAAFDQRVTRLFAALPRSLPAALVVLDLDRFKPINDQHGHAAGDAMLRAIASVAALRVRPGDLLVRLGGDEFAVVLERCSAEAAARVADELRTAIAGVRLPWEGRLLDVDASAGVAMLHDGTADAAAWLAEADRACYAAKAAGRGRVAAPASGEAHPGLRLVVDRAPPHSPEGDSAQQSGA